MPLTRIPIAILIERGIGAPEKEVPEVSRVG
jgi:hypothetical protein